MAASATIKLNSDMEQRIQRLAVALQRSPQTVMEEAVEEYLDRWERLEQFRLDTLSALEHYETTGLHTTEEEMDAWIAKLGAGEDASAPECHV